MRGNIWLFNLQEMPLIIVLSGILLLFLLILVFRLNASFPLSLFRSCCPCRGYESGHKPLLPLKLDRINPRFLANILGFGAMLGKLVADSGAAQQITSRIIQAFGIKRVQMALMLTGFIVGIPLFYDVGFVIMIPLVFTVAASAGLPLLYVGLPMLASLSVTHGYLPPHPAPSAIATTFGADIGLTLGYGIIVAIPAIVISGPVYARVIRNVRAKP